MGTLATIAIRAGFIALALLLPQTLHAERLSITAYTVGDGLPHAIVKKIVADSKGYVWFATRGGLARFDGRQFLTYDVQDGLPIPSVNHVLVTSRGAYWVATNGGGICRLRTEATRDRSPDAGLLRFEMCAARDNPATNRVNVLFEDRRGQIWAGSDGGLLRVVETSVGAALEPVAMDLPGRSDHAVQVWDFAESEDGSLWLGTSWGLVRRIGGGQTVHYRIAPAQGADHVRALMADHNRIWIGHATGLIVFRPDHLASGVPLERQRSLNIRSRSYSPRPMLPTVGGESVRLATAPDSSSDFVLALHRSSDGSIWIGSRKGLAHFDGTRLVTYRSPGESPYVGAITEDTWGHIWIAGLTGALKVARTGFVTYTAEDGLPPRIRSLFESHSGDLLVSGWPWLCRFDGVQFTRIPINLSADRRAVDLTATVLQTRVGEWWVPGAAGLYRFPAVATPAQLARARPTAIYSTRDGLAGDDVYRLFEDSFGNVWIGTWVPTRTVLTRWNRATGRFDRFTDADGLPAFSRPLAFGEDSAGSVWIGFWNGGVARYRHGQFTLFTASDNVPGGPIGHLYTDLKGRLWIGSYSNGVSRLDAPDADRPRFIRYTMAEGLSSNHVTAITGDRLGRIYLGTFPMSGTLSSIDRLDPATGHVRHYTLPPAFQGAEVETGFRDRHGMLWFATAGGLVSLEPTRDGLSSPPSIYISGVRVAGAAYDVSALGEILVDGLELKPDQNQLEIEYFSVVAASPVRYQYQLEGADQSWSEPTSQQSIHYANLPPGRYRFLVRAISADGQLSLEPASVAFYIAPPFWQRSWFLAVAAMLVALVTYALHRIRLARLLELERVRIRIATDLHDDIGSSLTQIAILSEVAERQMAVRDPTVVEPISRVSTISRELVDAMSEIVWAINPRHDRLQDLAARMRRFATDVLASRHVAFSFRVPEPAVDMTMSADERRQCFLVFKEAIHNAVRHSACTEVAVEMSVVGRVFNWMVSDNGMGFDPRRATPGQGLRSMAARARAMGGHLEIVSQPGGGTTVRFAVALARRTMPRISGGRRREAPPAA